jgi:DNA-binding response OmpR family regulator
MRLLLLTQAVEPSTEVLPALGLLAHQVRVAPAQATALLNVHDIDVLLVDARADLPAVRSLTRLLRQTGVPSPLLVIVTEGGVTALQSDWGHDDFLLESAGPAEVEARLRVCAARYGATLDSSAASTDEIRRGDLTIDEAGYTARIRSRILDLTYKEFELLRFLAQHPGRVFSRTQLLQEVWGYDYFGGTRTVDVHVRRLRAKLGPGHESLVGTVRNVGYRFVPGRTDEKTNAALSHSHDDRAITHATSDLGPTIT